MADIGNFSSRGTSDMLLRDSNTDGLEVYDINSNQITGAAFIGAVGLDWQFSGVGTAEFDHKRLDRTTSLMTVAGKRFTPDWGSLHRSRVRTDADPTPLSPPES